MDRDESYEDTCEDKEHEWLLYFQNDVLSTAFRYARYSKGMEELTGFGMKIEKHSNFTKFCKKLF